MDQIVLSLRALLKPYWQALSFATPPNSVAGYEGWQHHPSLWRVIYYMTNWAFAANKLEQQDNSRC